MFEVGLWDKNASNAFKSNYNSSANLIRKAFVKHGEITLLIQCFCYVRNPVKVAEYNHRWLLMRLCDY